MKTKNSESVAYQSLYAHRSPLKTKTFQVKKRGYAIALGVIDLIDEVNACIGGNTIFKDLRDEAEHHEFANTQRGVGADLWRAGVEAKCSDMQLVKDIGSSRVTSLDKIGQLRKLILGQEPVHSNGKLKKLTGTRHKERDIAHIEKQVWIDA